MYQHSSEYGQKGIGELLFNGKLVRLQRAMCCCPRRDANQDIAHNLLRLL
jgi:hypothetical protein